MLYTDYNPHIYQHRTKLVDIYGVLSGSYVTQAHYPHMMLWTTAQFRSLSKYNVPLVYFSTCPFPVALFISSSITPWKLCPGCLISFSRLYMCSSILILFCIFYHLRRYGVNVFLPLKQKLHPIHYPKTIYNYPLLTTLSYIYLLKNKCLYILSTLK